MTKPNDMITITNDDIEISLPVSALAHYDQVVELAHLVILGDAVPERAGTEAITKLKEAMASGNPLEALKKMRDGLQPEPPDRKDLKAEVIEKGEKPKDDPMVRLAEVAKKCAESVGLEVPKGTTVVQIIPAITQRTTRLQTQMAELENLSGSCMREAGAYPSEESGHVAVAKNIQNLGTGLKQQMASIKGGWKAVKVLRDTMVVLGITVRERHNASLELCIGDCQEALSLAARRGVTLKSGAEGVKA